MAKITRKLQKIFGGSLTPSNNIAVFGSLKGGSPAYSGDPDTIQSAAYLLGWSDAVVANQAPALQDMNALFYVLSYNASYGQQSGVPEWDAGTIYYIGSIASDGVGGLYYSLTDANTNNALSDTTNWRVYVSQKVVSTSGNLTVAYDTNLLLCTGSSAIAVTIPQAVAANTGRSLTIKSVQTSGAVTTITATGGSLIDGNSSYIIGLYGTVTLISNGSAWEVVSINANAVLGNPAGVAPGTGYLGQVVQTDGSAVAMTTSQWTDGGAAGTTLQPGTWDIEATAWINPDTTTTFQWVEVGVGTVSGNSSTGVTLGRNVTAIPFPNASAGGNWFVLTTPRYRVNITTPTTYYPKSFAIFGTSTATSFNYLRATRAG